MNSEKGNVNKKLLVLFGASGDLFMNKLAPSLSRLFSQGRLSDVDIWGVSRKTWTDDQFRGLIADAISKKGRGPVSEDFLNLCYFKTADISDENKIDDFLTLINNLKKTAHYSDVFIYLSISPHLYEPFFQSIKKNKIEVGDWLKIIVEKPYGTSSEQAEKLNSTLDGVIPESSIYRIDHYLTKETMQDILAFRFANEIFRPVWNAEHISSIRVAMHESITVEDRSEFYDKVGALFDVGQNHVLQMLTAVTMDEPESFSSDSFHKSRNSIFEKLVVNPNYSCIRGQYDSYKTHKGVAENSETETFFSIGLELATQSYKGVPIIIESGKGLLEKKSFIKVEFKPREIKVIKDQKGVAVPNNITFHLFPHEKIEINILGKAAGLNSELKERSFSFSIQDTPEYTGSDIAYEQVFFEALSCDRTLFASSSEVVLGWKLAESAMKALKRTPLITYKLGTNPESLHGILDS